MGDLFRMSPSRALVAACAMRRFQERVAGGVLKRPLCVACAVLFVTCGGQPTEGPRSYPVWGVVIDSVTGREVEGVVVSFGLAVDTTDAGGHYSVEVDSGSKDCTLEHPRFEWALEEQSKRLVHVSNLYYTRPQTELAQLLVENSFADRVFFCNSGAEANEAAIKLARRYMSGPDPHRHVIISMTNSFHGRTMATL